jgi:gas vesicle protein/predicted nucleotidyltransferase
MRPTRSALDQHPGAEAVVNALRDELVAILGDSLTGLYVSGSLAVGDFDERSSDIDAVAVIKGPLGRGHLVLIDAAHHAVVDQFPDWDDRLEVLYVDGEELARRGAAAYPSAVLGPGQPFHRPPARTSPSDDEWLLQWRALRESAIALHGPPPGQLVAPISNEQTRERIRKDLQRWPDLIEQSTARHAGWQANAILTVCRGACELATGQTVSKLTAAEWAKTSWPDHAELIERAIASRSSEIQTTHVQDHISHPETVSFIRDAASRASKL